MKITTIISEMQMFQAVKYHFSLKEFALRSFFGSFFNVTVILFLSTKLLSPKNKTNKQTEKTVFLSRKQTERT